VDGGSYEQLVTTDTSYRVPLEAVGRYRVTAVDSNTYRFTRDSTATRAGVSNAYGLFWATSGAEIVLPSPAS
jgi:hypothetical protein